MPNDVPTVKNYFVQLLLAQCTIMLIQCVATLQLRAFHQNGIDTRFECPVLVSASELNMQHYVFGIRCRKAFGRQLK